MVLPAVVIDNGALNLRAGWSGEFEPRVTFESSVARFSIDKHHQRHFAGKDIARAPRGSTISHVFADSSHIDWKGVEKLWLHTVHDKLHADDREEYNFLVTEPPLSSAVNRAKMAEILFETCKAKGVYFGATSTMALFSSGLSTGVVVDSGYRTTYVAPIFEGYLLPLTAQKVGFGGATVDEFLQDLLAAKEQPITLSEALQLKEQHAYVAQDFFDERVAADRAGDGFSYELPDGHVVKLSAERFTCTELMFQPQLAGISEDPLPYTTHQAIAKSDHALQKQLFNSIVLAGGNTMMPGLASRLAKGLTHLAPASVKVEVHSQPQRNYATWTGGSLLASQSQMEQVWVTKEEFQEQGADVLAIRCL